MNIRLTALGRKALGMSVDSCLEGEKSRASLPSNRMTSVSRQDAKMTKYVYGLTFLPLSRLLEMTKGLRLGLGLITTAMTAADPICRRDILMAKLGRALSPLLCVVYQVYQVAFSRTGPPFACHKPICAPPHRNVGYLPVLPSANYATAVLPSKYGTR